ncbi:GNAT family N-acetyltransferase [Gracilibacillus oryzae]|uniref:GNAT family N-acetyltransferase n=1 Tax=Gracilibacillus oryzae TaxID=1672701 RepID=A0A7C8L4U8_9BACI|nr:GNAT family N-acetyltransferase [Gracilibacillus oryzae]KAB8138088.1 GNAT family N-acetyltransferase [Gracilibacillus oryzae]
MSGPAAFIQKFIPYVDVKRNRKSHLGVVKKLSTNRKYPELEVKLVRSDEEIGMQYDLFHLTDEFTGSLPEKKADYIRMESERLKATNDRTAYVSIDNKMAASCATIREGIKSAIIIGVFTNPEYRGRGFGTEVLTGLFDMLLQEGKYPYLFYSNPVARKVYKKIGMTEICEWCVLEV